MNTTYTITDEQLKESIPNGLKVQLRNGKHALVIGRIPQIEGMSSFDSTYPLIGYTAGGLRIHWTREGQARREHTSNIDIIGLWVDKPIINDEWSFNDNHIKTIIGVDEDRVWVKGKDSKGIVCYSTYQVSDFVVNHTLKKRPV